MNEVMHREKQLESLESNGAISYKEICDILDAFQISSGQSFAIRKTKALLDYIKKGNVIVIENFNFSDNTKIIPSLKELAKIYKDIDQSIDLTTDKDFISYFS